MFGWEIDPSRVAFGFVTYGDLVFFAAIIAVGSIFIHFRKQILQTFREDYLAIRKFGFFWRLRMGKAEDEAVAIRLRERTHKWIEADVETGKMTRRQADGWYARLSRHWPEFRHCIDYPKMAPKERIKEDQLNRERLPDGSVKPLPLPNGGAAPKKTKPKMLIR